MKIVCDACSAKYSIADEKVRGKVFKIRCKKCSNIIVVRGDADAQSDASTAGADPASDGAVWHVVIDQDQVGPMTDAEVHDRYARGEIDSESYVWREGFEDWLRLADVAELGIGGGSSETQVAASAGAGAASAGAGMFGGPAVEDTAAAQSDPHDLFSSQSGVGFSPGGGDMFGGGEAPMAAASSQPASDGMFAGANGAGGGGGDLQVESQLKGQRNESSVLFSLGNLASLANEAPRSTGGSSAPPSGTASTSAPSSGGTTEGSGLIDIRSMASVYLGEKSEAKPAGTVDDLPVFATSSFEAVSPVLLPSTAPQPTDKKLLYGLIGVIAFLLIAAVVLVAVLLSGGDGEGEATRLAQTMTDARAAAVNPAATEPGDSETEVEPKTDPTPAPSEAEKPATETEKPAAAEKPSTRENRDRDRNRERARDRNRNRNRDRDRNRREQREPEPKPEPKASSDSGGCDEISCLVTPNKPCCRKYRSGGGGGGGGAASSNLPASPSKSNVLSGVRRVTSRVASCGNRHNASGMIKVRIKIAPSGRVSSANAKTSNGGLASCIERAVKRARFEKSKRGVTVNYPFMF